MTTPYHRAISARLFLPQLTINRYAVLILLKFDEPDCSPVPYAIFRQKPDTEPFKENYDYLKFQREVSVPDDACDPTAEITMRRRSVWPMTCLPGS